MRSARTIIIGAGMAGLTAARLLSTAGHDVTVLDKGRSPGGRMATRRLGEARIDHGAQFFTVRTAAFAQQVATWEHEGLARVWSRGLGAGTTADQHPRYIGTNGMTAIPKAMAEGLDLRCEHMVFSIRRPVTKASAHTSGHAWEVVIDDGTVLSADHVILTSPIPQTASLLMESGISVPEQLWRTEYHRTIGLLISTDGPSALSPPGALTAADLSSSEPESNHLNFVADQYLKGISADHAVLVHANYDWSLRWWDEDPHATSEALLGMAAAFLGTARVRETQLKKWRLATPAQLWPEAFWTDPTRSLYIAGDAFSAGHPEQPKVANLEGAFLSGHAAAQHLLAVTHHGD
jgi:predicted NAD/FAD-dependent oxidoreductase